LSSFREVFLFSASPDLIPAISTSSLLESIFEFKVNKWFADTQKRPSSVYVAIKLIQIRAFSPSYPRTIDHSFTDGKGIGVWSYHVNFGHWKATIFISIVLWIKVGLERWASCFSDEWS
jgi:hypothetical protein